VTWRRRYDKPSRRRVLDRSLQQRVGPDVDVDRVGIVDNRPQLASSTRVATDSEIPASHQSHNAITGLSLLP